tara:strand:- start:52 stop:747 length:696 start_codon:yes stop_codon:yes gene_type:complete
MNKIHAFGCSLTAQHHWSHLEHEVSIPDEDWYGITEWSKGEFSVRSYAINGGSNDMQVISYGNEVHKNNIDVDDIVIWQLTSPNRIGITKSNIEDTDCRDNGVLVDDNIYTDTPARIINISISSKLNSESLRTETGIYSTLWCLNGIKRRNTRTLAVFGWDSCFPRKDRVIQFLKENDIDCIEESILEYSHRKGHPDGDTNHPVSAGYKDFTENKLLPKLKELEWIRNRDE